jgi:uncharacterized repeat protein (TIGR03847 family)
MSKRVIYRHDPAANFIVGTVGEPGERTFFLQFESISGINSISLEKAQLIALVERFEELIRELKRKKLASEEEIFAPAIKLNGELEYPIDEDFRAGVMGITWQPEDERVSLEVQEFSEMEEFSDLVQIDEDTSDQDFPPDILEAVLTIAQIRGFIKLADEVISAGRELCPFCGLPIDLTGHLCPRANGYKR